VQTQLHWLPDGDPAQTLAATATMRELAIQGEMTPAVRQVAAYLVQGLPRNQLLYATNIAGWVAARTRFLYDPQHMEAFVPADQTLALISQQGIAQVDCDDVAILAAALGLSVGLRARFVVVGFYAPDAPFEHIWTELSDADGQTWIAVDPSRPLMGLPPVLRPPLVVEV
jgi:transglutaminase-like putative cysteine protease